MTFDPLEPVFIGDSLPGALNEERAAINDVQEQVKTRIPLPSGAATGDLLRWDGAQWGTTETRFFEGNGRPDGNFAAPVGSRYIDKTAAQGAVEWVKRSGEDSAVGWMCLAGDTGWRNISALVDKRSNGLVHSALVRRINGVVDLYFDLTMPSSTPTWILYAALVGFSPNVYRYAVLNENAHVAVTGNAINLDGGVILVGTKAGIRERFSGTYTTSDPWPATLPGTAL